MTIKGGYKYTGSPCKTAKIILTILLAIFFVSTTGDVVAAYYHSEYQIGEYANTSGEILVIYNKKLISFNSTIKPFIADGICYVPIREIADALNAVITWEKNNKTAHIYKGHEHIYFKMRNEFAYHNGKRTTMPPAYLYKGKTIVPVKFFCDKLGFEMKWDSHLRAISISDSGVFPTKNEILNLSPKQMVRKGTYNSSKYTFEDIYWLSKIVHAEANGESYRSKLVVANVIINRANNNDYPDSIKEVIFDKAHGVQFTPTLNGSIYNQPSDESIASAVDALNGNNNAKGILFFLNPKYAASSWIVKNREFAFSLENHDFYY